MTGLTLIYLALAVINAFAFPTVTLDDSTPLPDMTYVSPHPASGDYSSSEWPFFHSNPDFYDDPFDNYPEDPYEDYPELYGTYKPDNGFPMSATTSGYVFFPDHYPVLDSPM
ncbi:hypothetical protein L596_023008 [Steinernema carpocapsae]|uniref:Uncharacterized protein n=1 Tax=Steinernema carpocapsae TaxID=34508 RepID=A0A4U5MD67_STECR|nr:hypothetical protein L596_023008 [Steinernema carpocapsae]